MYSNLSEWTSLEVGAARQPGGFIGATNFHFCVWKKVVFGCSRKPLRVRVRVRAAIGIVVVACLGARILSSSKARQQFRVGIRRSTELFPEALHDIKMRILHCDAEGCLSILRRLVDVRAELLAKCANN